MYRFRIFIIALVAWLGIIFNIERPDSVGSLGNINFSPTLYVFILGILCILLVAPRLSYIPASLIVIGSVLIYIPIRIGIEEFDAQAVNLVFLVEIFVLIGTVFAIRSLSKIIIGLEDTVTESIFKSSKTLPELQGKKQIESEILRARQFKRELWVLAIESNAIQNGNPLNTYLKFGSHFQLGYKRMCIAQALETLARPGDILAWNGNNLIICLPNISNKEIIRLKTTVEDMLVGVFHLQVRIGLANFPSDGYVMEDLVEHALRISESNTKSESIQGVA